MRDMSPTLFLRKVYRRIFPKLEDALMRSLKSKRGRTEKTILKLPGVGSVKGLSNLEAYNEYKDIFYQRIYDFHPQRKAPVIIDGGAYVGMTSIYLASKYPEARIYAVEAHPETAKLLQENLKNCNADRVQVCPWALSGKEGKTLLSAGGGDGATVLSKSLTGDGVEVPAKTLSTMIEEVGEQVDFLKLNIEGAELEVLKEAAQSGALSKVKECVIEVHSFPGMQQILGPLLCLLDEQNFHYLVNHIDYDSNLAVRPPFYLDNNSAWIVLVYARNRATT